MQRDNAEETRRPLYFDYQSTTPIDPQVLDYMQVVERTVFGNAASKTHDFGREALEVVELARSKVARLADCDSSEVFFTSGATESINLALKGLWLAGRTPTFVSFATEHSAVLDTLRWLSAQGATVHILPVEPTGNIRGGALAAFESDETAVLSIAHGNNEVGTIHPIEALKPSFKGLLHVDAAQTFGKVPLSVRKSQFDLLSVSSHKVYGPKGVGAFIKRRQHPPLRVEPLIHGGGHERGLRSGTLNVPDIAGFGMACDLAAQRLHEEQEQITLLRNLLLHELNRVASPLIVNGIWSNRLPGNLNVSFPGIAGPELIPRLRSKLAVSSGSACSSAHQSPSHVLKALGVSDTLAAASIRVGIGRFTSKDDVLVCARILGEAVADLRKDASS